MNDWKEKFERLDKDFLEHIDFLKKQIQVRTENKSFQNPPYRTEVDGLNVALVSAVAFYQGSWQSQNAVKKKKPSKTKK